MLKNSCQITKHFFQIFLYLLEVIGVAYLLTYLTNEYYPTCNDMAFIERMVMFYTVYQIIIFGVLNQLNDIKKDEYLALLTTYKYVELYYFDKKEWIANEIKRILNYQLDGATFNDNYIRKEYLFIKNMIEKNDEIDISIIKVKIIKYEHFLEEATLSWKYSILARLFK